jgi:hypothetical protein
VTGTVLIDTKEVKLDSTLGIQAGPVQPANRSVRVKQAEQEISADSRELPVSLKALRNLEHS